MSIPVSFSLIIRWLLEHPVDNIYEWLKVNIVLHFKYLLGCIDTQICKNWAQAVFCTASAMTLTEPKQFIVHFLICFWSRAFGCSLWALVSFMCSLNHLKKKHVCMCVCVSCVNFLIDKFIYRYIHLPIWICILISIFFWLIYSSKSWSSLSSQICLKPTAQYPKIHY